MRHGPVLLPLPALVALAVTVAAGCGLSSGGSQSSGVSTTEPPPPSVASDRDTPGTVPTGGRARLDGFGEVTVTVVGPDGRTHTVCLLLAETPAQHERGLMYVEDAALGGYDGMLFRSERDESGAFWMRHTRLPLSIAWFRADGALVSSTDMAPCPDRADSCPTYPPGGPYRYAVEVPAGRLDDLGIATGSRVSVGASSCAPR
jgi:uncharacterized membrane protein (UPF0127 family)